MDYNPLGRSGLKISRLCLGTWNFGSLTDEPAFSAPPAVLSVPVSVPTLGRNGLGAATSISGLV